MLVKSKENRKLLLRYRNLRWIGNDITENDCWDVISVQIAKNFEKHWNTSFEGRATKMTYNFLISKYLSPAHLAGFDKYKYSSIDNSPLSIYITHPFWNQCVKVRSYRWLSAVDSILFDFNLGFLLVIIYFIFSLNFLFSEMGYGFSTFLEEPEENIGDHTYCN